MSADRRVYLTSPKVRHIAVYVGSGWWPACNSPTDPDLVKILAAAWPGDQADARWQLPVCKRCGTVAAIVTAAAEDVPESCLVEVITADWLAS